MKTNSVHCKGKPIPDNSNKTRKIKYEETLDDEEYLMFLQLLVQIKIKREKEMENHKTK